MTSRLEKICAERGLKMTEQRRVISRVLSDAQDHPDVEEIYRRASKIDPKISIATVYRTMRLYEDANIIERNDFGDGRARYEENREEHHHHLIDVNSGKVIEFQSEELEKLKAKIARDLGYDLIGDRLELYGVQRTKSGKQRVAAALPEFKRFGLIRVGLSKTTQALIH